VAILDFGSQYTQLIARRVREHGVHSRIFPFDVPLSELEELKPIGLIFSGGPASVYDEGAPAFNRELLDLQVPVLGICYGLQSVVKALGGRVQRSEEGGEYGRTRTRIVRESPLTVGLEDAITVWMSHGDRVEALPEGFQVLAESEVCPFAAVEGMDGRFFGLQFHPEVTHTEMGDKILKNFLYGPCDARGDWEMESIVKSAVASIRASAAGEKVVLGLSGGVDSSVAALLIQRAIGDGLECIFVDNCFLRAGEAEQVVETFRDHFKVRLHEVDASQRFLTAIEGITDPEEKRRRIGHTFIDVFKEVAQSIKGVHYLAQGTLYPDVIESVSAHGGPTAVIKTHHNVGGLPDELGFELIEPLKDLFKDEVRRIGHLLGLPSSIVNRHPFPGPGLAVRIVGKVTREDLALLRQADAILLEEIRNAGYYDRTSQVFAVLLPVQSVGVMGDARTYDRVIAVRAVVTEDFMTADWARLPYDLLAAIANRITNEVKGINRVVYDVSSKPPATIEWE
jgi:GMP synthase (glutamine-hydrolysing)